MKLGFCVLSITDLVESSGVMIKLSSSNYSIWKSMMEDLFYCKDLYLLLGGDAAKPQDKSDADWEKLHKRTVGYIRQWVDQSVYHHVAQETRADIL